MELIHVATLIHDDVVDRSRYAAWSERYGCRLRESDQRAGGDYLFAWIFANVTANYPAPIPHILSATLAAICDGEVLQLRALGKLEPSTETYVEIARKKTATLFAASVECGAIAGGGNAEEIAALRGFGDYYGIAFQMNDDLLDMTANEQTLGKPVGNDLRERKMTIPLILALANGDAGFRIDIERFYHRSRDQRACPAENFIAGIGESGGFRSNPGADCRVCRPRESTLAPLGASPAKAELARLADALIPGLVPWTKKVSTCFNPL